MVRIKQRYLLLNILYPDSNTSKVASGTPDFLKFHAPTPQYITSQLFLSHLRTHIADLFGDQGLGLCLSSLKLVYFSNATSTAILRVPRASHQIVWATLSHMTEMPGPRGKKAVGSRCVVRVVRVSGTIRKAEEELLRRTRRYIVQAKLSGTEGSDAVLKRLTESTESMPRSLDDGRVESADEDFNDGSDSD